MILLLTGSPVDPWADFFPALTAGGISGLFTGLVTGLIVGVLLNRGQRKATAIAIDREYELQWQSIRSAVLLAIAVNDMPDPDDSTRRTPSQLRMQEAIGNNPVRVWAAHLRSSELDALVSLLNAWDRRALTHAKASSAVGVKVIAAAAAAGGVDIGLTHGMWGLVTNAYNTGFPPAAALWAKAQSDPSFVTTVAQFRADYIAVHAARNTLEQALTNAPE